MLRAIVLILSGLTMTVLFNNCDGIKTPTVAKSFQSVMFNHDGITANCASCHATGKSFAAMPTGHIATNGQDCGACHNTFAWANGSSPHIPGAPAPTTCIACHTAAVPMGTVGSGSLVSNITPVGGLFDHASGPGAGDCVTCHSSIAANIGVSWVGGVFSHAPVPGMCINCHTAAQRPVGSIATNGSTFDHGTAPGGTGDCVACHASATNVGRTWLQGAFSHSPTPTACAVCHTGDTQYLAIQNVIKNQMSHTFAGMPDCAKCHTTGALASNWTSYVAESGVTNGVSTARASVGVFHANFGPNPTSCTACHVNERPVGPVGSPAFDHAAGGTGECAGCHLAVPANIGKTWAGGSIAHTSFTACASCHTADKPVGTVPNTKDGFNHDVKYGTECATCHTIVKANVGVSWTNGFFGHQNNNSGAFTNCSPCHDTRQHHAGTNCASCHTIKWPAPAANGNYGGSFGGG